MPVGNKIEQTIAAAQTVQSNLKTFALDTDDEQAKQMFNQLASSMENAINQLKSRLNYVQEEEPQFRKS